MPHDPHGSWVEPITQQLRELHWDRETRPGHQEHIQTIIGKLQVGEPLNPHDAQFLIDNVDDLEKVIALTEWQKAQDKEVSETTLSILNR